MVDEKDGSTRNITPSDFLDRAEAIGRQWKRARWADERNEFIKAANEMEKCAAEASAQGDPTDQKVSDYHRRHKTYRKPWSQGVSLQPTSPLILPKPRRLILPSSN